VVQQGIESLHKVIVEGGYEAKDIFNCDETGLFWLSRPNRTLALRAEQAKGTRKSKNRVTVLFICNADGSEKHPLIIIGRTQPRALTGKNLSSLSVTYAKQGKAWMDRLIFFAWLNDFNDQMRRQGRKVLLILDNARIHFVDFSKVSHVKVHFIPPNTTSRIQPLDIGIIRMFKAVYKRLVCIAVSFPFFFLSFKFFLSLLDTDCFFLSLLVAHRAHAAPLRQEAGSDRTGVTAVCWCKKQQEEASFSA
jgi:hypothetical protein